MKVFMVFIIIKERTAGAPRTLARWLDSQWANRTAAVDRIKEVEASMRHFECYRAPGTDTGAAAEIVEGSVVDVAITDSKKQDIKASPQDT